MRLPSWVSGRRSERLAARHLRRVGLDIVARNVRGGRDEIDLVARDGGVVAVVEVRRRQGGPLAADLSVDPSKVDRLWRAWHAVRRRYRIPDLPVRFDLVLVGDNRLPVHLAGVLHRQANRRGS